MDGASCIFCRIVKKEKDAYIVYEDGEILAFLDAYPISEGHTLVIPKKHYSGILDIPEETAGRAMAVAKKLALEYSTKLNAFEFNIMQSSGEEAGQTVFHFHIHVVPRRKGDNLSLWLHKNEKSAVDTKTVYKKLGKEKA